MPKLPTTCSPRALALPIGLILCASLTASAQLPGRPAGPGIVVGLEYALLDNQRVVASTARTLAETGLTGMKHYVEAVSWGNMQPGPNRPINFTKLDWFVQEFQGSGFTELTLALRPQSSWGSKHGPRFGARNLSPSRSIGTPSSVGDGGRRALRRRRSR